MARRKKKTPSFVAEFPLVVTPAEAHELSIRLEAARQIYNAGLGEALRLLKLMRESKAWRVARKISKKNKKERTEAFTTVAKTFGYTSNDLQKFTRQCRVDCWIDDHAGSHDTQAMTKRAFRAVQQYGFGKKGRPRFKGSNQVHSVEAQDNRGCIRFRTVNDVLMIQWSGLSLPLMLDPRDSDGWQEQALACRTKYCRIFRRTINGEVRWYCHLVQEGLPPRKERNVVSNGTVGLDIGPSTIAVVSDEAAELHTFCPTVQEPWKETRRILRAMDRSRRATNPNNYDEKGRNKPGKHNWNKSSRYKKLQTKHAESQRKLAAERKRSHGELCNRILAQGKEIKTEKLSYVAFQKLFGRSVKVRAPGMFVTMLTRKAVNAGGSVTQINTRNTKLSQYDHTTDTYTKKPLSQRTHFFGDGETQPVQRDLYSAFLAKHCDQDSLDVHQVQCTWPAAEPLLRRATSKGKQPSVSRNSSVVSHEETRQNRSSVTEEVKPPRGSEGVPQRRRCARIRESDGGFLRTPSGEVQIDLSQQLPGTARPPGEGTPL